jgi:hypothetical protein
MPALPAVDGRGGGGEGGDVGRHGNCLSKSNAHGYDRC